jgi:hypothetical protein
MKCARAASEIIFWALADSHDFPAYKNEGNRNTEVKEMNYENQDWRKGRG